VTISANQLSEDIPVCGNCKHLARCNWLIGKDKDDEGCDFSPSRFIQVEPIKKKELP
jgi:hypothetical protein